MAHDELCPVAPPHEILLPYAVPGLLQGGEGRLYQGSALSRDLRTERQAGPLYPEGSLYLSLAHQGVLLFHVFNGLFLIRREHGHRRGSHVLLIMRFEPVMAGRALYTDLLERFGYRLSLRRLFIHAVDDVFFLLVNGMSWVLDPGPSLFSGS